MRHRVRRTTVGRRVHGRRLPVVVVRHVARAHLQPPRVQPVFGLAAAAAARGRERVPFLSVRVRCAAHRSRVGLRPEFQLELHVRVRAQPEANAQPGVRTCGHVNRSETPCRSFDAFGRRPAGRYWVRSVRTREGRDGEGFKDETFRFCFCFYFSFTRNRRFTMWFKLYRFYSPTMTGYCELDCKVRLVWNKIIMLLCFFSTILPSRPSFYTLHFDPKNTSIDRNRTLDRFIV